MVHFCSSSRAHVAVSNRNRLSASLGRPPGALIILPKGRRMQENVIEIKGPRHLYGGRLIHDGLDLAVPRGRGALLPVGRAGASEAARAS